MAELALASLAARTSRRGGRSRPRAGGARARRGRRRPRSPPLSRALGRGRRCRSMPTRERAGERGQASVLLVGLLLAVLVGALVLAALARGVDVQAGAAAGGGSRRAGRGAGDARRVPAAVRARAGDLHASRRTGRAGERAALETARRNGAEDVEVAFPDGDSFAPVRIAVTVARPDRRRRAARCASPRGRRPSSRRRRRWRSLARRGEYAGPLAYRQGKPMRPDVAQRVRPDGARRRGRTASR